MMLVRCHLARSEIEGLGVFAGEPIRKGRQVWRFHRTFDILVHADELAKAPPTVVELFERYAYSLASYPEHMALDGDDGRFMNHSEAPNLDFSVPGVATALRDIEAGEELTCNYDDLASGPYEMQPPLHRV